MAADAATWLAEQGDALPGLPESDAAALATAAGLVVRTAAPGAVLTLDYRPRRVTLRLDAAGTVLDATAG